MKKKIIRIIKKSFIMILGSFVLNIIFIGVIWKTKQYNISERYVKPDAKKILFHLFGVENMSSEDKIAILERSESFREYFVGKIDTAVANRVFVDQSPNYAIDAEFVIDFHLSHGNPEIQIGFAGWFRDHFNPITGMSISAFNSLGEPKAISLFSYFSEMSHAMQFDNDPYGYEIESLEGVIESICLVVKNGCSFETAYNSQYNQEGSLEYEAHSVIYNELKKKYLDHRCICFKTQIDEVEKKIFDHHAKQTKNKGSAWEKFRPELKELQAKMDSLVYGPLFSW